LGEDGVKGEWRRGRTIWFLVHGRWKLGGWSFGSSVWQDVAEGFTYSWRNEPQVHSSTGPLAQYKTAVTDWRCFILMFCDDLSKRHQTLFSPAFIELFIRKYVILEEAS
jgi:hypothetical protein